jgi:hypothetical protein
VVVRQSVPAGATRALAVQQRTKLPVGAIVEYAGEDLVAFHSLALRDPSFGTGVAEAACGRPGPVEVVVPQATTVGGDTLIALINPGSADAVVSIRLLTDGAVLAPERLSQRVVPARGRLILRVGDFAFDKRDVTAVVDTLSGRAVVEGLVTGSSLSLEPAVVPARHILAPVGATGEGVLSVTGVGQDDSQLTASVLTRAQQGAAAGIPPSLAALSSIVVAVPDAGGAAPAGYALDANLGAPIVAGARWTVRRSGQSATASAIAAEPAARWTGVIQAYSGRSTVRALIANSGGARALVRLVSLTPDGRHVVRTVSIGPARLTSLVVAETPGVYAIEATADRPVVVAMTSVGGASFLQAAAATAVALEPLYGVAVSLDRRIGVPAPLTR